MLLMRGDLLTQEKKNIETQRNVFQLDSFTTGAQQPTWRLRMSKKAMWETDNNISLEFDFLVLL